MNDERREGNHAEPDRGRDHPHRTGADEERPKEQVERSAHQSGLTVAAVSCAVPPNVSWPMTKSSSDLTPASSGLSEASRLMAKNGRRRR